MSLVHFLTRRNGRTLFEWDISLLLSSFGRCPGSLFRGAGAGADFCGDVFGMEEHVTVSGGDTVEARIEPVGRY